MPICCTLGIQCEPTMHNVSAQTFRDSIAVEVQMVVTIPPHLIRQCNQETQTDFNILDNNNSSDSLPLTSTSPSNHALDTSFHLSDETEYSEDEKFEEIKKVPSAVIVYWTAL